MGRLVARVFRAALVASAFLFFWVGAALLAWTFCPLLVLVQKDETRRWRWCQRVVKRTFRLFHGYMGTLTLLEVRAHGKPGRPPGPLVIVANHPTLVDVTAVLAHYDDVCCVVKSSLVRNVFVGRLLRVCGHVDGGDGQWMSGVELLQQAQRRLEAGMAVLVFPEGTRSPPAGMHPFRRGAFELAARARVPIWPLVLTCNPSALSKGLPFWKQPEQMARLRIHAGELVPAPTDAHHAARAVEAAFRERLAIPSPTERPALGPSHPRPLGLDAASPTRRSRPPPASVHDEMPHSQLP